ncbi:MULTISPECIES: helix-turn-helix domain-containing protein [Streptomyces]|uniref:Transcriptional regulator with XRE-family HTH domain n=2 Tax=Streptomyces TaxID=1883 RepID=A0ABT9KV22_9ACTN|nr:MULTISPECIES: helix-turn-helix transcriptional regulator [Streptomyces]MBW8090407.1 helix-turn-helix domain-containing protein [Streptomyces hygroscopicus subsp. hygroscopicus]MCO8302740.1 helix-turn-helix transcriptional regulator [Streptomyces sp. RKCA744]MDP9612296.1 transcriptional regulator with XRE-family HTH domain [Streptomyces demainii]GHJ26444.1 transcriptional regulator [Streptomyces hygroscopicus]
MADEPNPLGDYVRARRELVTPEQAGIPVQGLRRVPGLRREEVAMLAGISADYYLRLEQGRDRNPSVQVLESLARVLRLDDDATAHLLRLGAATPRRQRRRPRQETVPPGTAKLIATLPLPAYVEGRYLDVLAANDVATALSPRLVAGANRLRDAFLDPAERALYPDWENALVDLVAGFRQSVGTETDDPRFIELVGELSLASPRFSRLWARHDVQRCGGVPLRLDHPQLGGLRLNRERLGIGGTAAQKLVIFHPDPGTDSAEKLALLASATRPPAAPRETTADHRRPGADTRHGA